MRCSIFFLEAEGYETELDPTKSYKLDTICLELQHFNTRISWEFSENNHPPLSSESKFLSIFTHVANFYMLLRRELGVMIMAMDDMILHSSSMIKPLSWHDHSSYIGFILLSWYDHSSYIGFNSMYDILIAL